MPQVIPPNLLAPAREYQGSAVVALLQSYAPLVHRLSTALCGDVGVGDAVTGAILRRAIRVLPRWRDDAEADRWFYHYTVLETRRAAATPLPQPGNTAADPLLASAARKDAPFVALVRAVRGLPAQQREAIVLHYGEHLNPRYLAVAMDCSAEAAANHLRVATLYLREMVGAEAAEPMLVDLGTAYQRLAPDTAALTPAIRRDVRRFLVPRRLRRVVVVLVLVGVAGAAWFGRHWIRSLWPA